MNYSLLCIKQHLPMLIVSCQDGHKTCVFLSLIHHDSGCECYVLEGQGEVRALLGSSASHFIYSGHYRTQPVRKLQMVINGPFCRSLNSISQRPKHTGLYHTHTHTYTQTHTHARTRTRTHARTHTRRHARTHTHTHTHTHARTHARTHTNTHTNTESCCLNHWLEKK